METTGVVILSYYLLQSAIQILHDYVLQVKFCHCPCFLESQGKRLVKCMLNASIL